MKKGPDKIPQLDLKAQYRKIKSEIRQAIDEVLESQQFILGPAVKKFEAQAATYLQSDAAIGVASGSDALLLALMALGIGPGDGVLVPPFTFFSSVSAITRLGATPVLVDIDPETYLMETNKIEAAVAERFKRSADGEGMIDAKTGSRLRAILSVHLFGRSCSMSGLLGVAREYRLMIVEDAAQALGAKALLSSGTAKAAGTIGDLGCFSFFPTKNLGGLGDGGLVATNQKELADKVRMLRVHGQGSRYHHLVTGLNSRLDEIQAAALSVKLRYLDQWCAERIERARRYHELFGATGLVGNRIIHLPEVTDGQTHVFNQFVVRVDRRDELKSYLQARGVQTAIYYPLALHLQPCFAHLGHRKGDFPNAELVSDQVLALPMYPELTREQQETVVQRTSEFFRH